MQRAWQYFKKLPAMLATSAYQHFVTRADFAKATSLVSASTPRNQAAFLALKA